MTEDKLLASLPESLIWAMPYYVRIVHTTILARVNARGKLLMSIHTLMRLAGVTRAEVEESIKALLAIQEKGRRLVAIEGGWKIVGYEDAQITDEKLNRNAYMAGLMRDKRAKAREEKGLPPIPAKRVKEVREPVPFDPRPIRPDEIQAPPYAGRMLTPVQPSQGAMATLAMRNAGYPPTHLNPLDPQLLNALAAGVTPDKLGELAAQYPGKNQAYLISVAMSQLIEAKEKAKAQSGTAGCLDGMNHKKTMAEILREN